jgi:hypothetical protein
MKKLAQITAVALALAAATSSALALTITSSCGGGKCVVTINGVSKTYPGKVALTSGGTVNGVDYYKVYIDGKLVDSKLK